MYSTPVFAVMYEESYHIEPGYNGTCLYLAHNCIIEIKTAFTLSGVRAMNFEQINLYMLM